MADQQRDQAVRVDLRATLIKRLEHVDRDLLTDRRGDPAPAYIVSALLADVEAFVAAQVAAARAKALHEAWLAVHVGRFDHESRGGAAGGPDNFYNGHLHAEHAIEALGVNVRETVHG